MERKCYPGTFAIRERNPVRDLLILKAAKKQKQSIDEIVGISVATGRNIPVPPSQITLVTLESET